MSHGIFSENNYSRSRSVTITQTTTVRSFTGKNTKRHQRVSWSCCCKQLRSQKLLYSARYWNIAENNLTLGAQKMTYDTYFWDRKWFCYCCRQNWLNILCFKNACHVKFFELIWKCLPGVLFILNTYCLLLLFIFVLLYCSIYLAGPIVKLSKDAHLETISYFSLGLSSLWYMRVGLSLLYLRYRFSLSDECMWW